MPHPAGKVSVSYTLKNNKWQIEISLPQKTSGILVWKTKTYVLKGGENSFVM